MTSEKRNYIWAVAIVSMCCDHVGKYLCSGELSFVLQCIGRVGLPTWGYAVAQGFLTTRSPGVYLKRVLAIATASILPYYYLTGQILNPVFSLSLGLGYLMARDYYAERMEHSYVPYLLLLLPVALPIDWYMAFMVALVGSAPEERMEDHAMVVLLTLMGLVSPWNLLGLVGVYVIRGPGALSWRPPLSLKYSFYPAHLGLIGIVQYLK